jgi:hypothetical protein
VFQWGFLFLLGIAALVVIVPVSAVLIALILTSGLDSADRLAAVGDVLVGATLLLGLAAALVTLLAFMTALGPPNLRVQLACECSASNNPVFQADRLKDGTLGITGIEWEAGPGYSIHPHSVRRLPVFT